MIFDFRRFWVGLLVGLPLILITNYAGIAQAHGGGTPQLANAAAGPYWVSVWTQPDPFRVGEAHFTVAVAEPPAPNAARQDESGPPVLDATVELQLKPIERPDQILTLFATHEAAVNKLFYEADVDLPGEGQWQVTISIDGPAGRGQADFEIDVLPPASFPVWALFGGLGLVLLGVGWVVFKAPNKKKHD